MSDFDSILNGDLSGQKFANQPPIVDPNQYPATAAKVDITSKLTEKPGPNFGKRWARLEVDFEVDDATQRERMAPRKPLARFSIMLDIIEDSSPAGFRLASEEDTPGANWRLRKFYEAMGFDTLPALSALRGRHARVTVKHEPSFNDKEVINATVSKVEQL